MNFDSEQLPESYSSESYFDQNNAYVEDSDIVMTDGGQRHENKHSDEEGPYRSNPLPGWVTALVGGAFMGHGALYGNETVFTVGTATALYGLNEVKNSQDITALSEQQYEHRADE